MQNRSARKVKLSTSSGRLIEVTHLSSKQQTHYNVVYSGKVKNKNVVVKQKQRTSPDYTTRSETAAIRLLNRHGMGPRFIGIDYNRMILVREKVGGAVHLKKSKKLITLIAKELCKIHKIKLVKYGRPFQRKKGSLQSFFVSEKRHLKDFFKHVDFGNKDVAKLWQQFLKIDKQTQAMFANTSVPFSLLNLDVVVNNVAVKNGRAHFFDWNAAKAGDPAMDISRLFVLNNFSSKEQRLFFEKYGKQINDPFLIQRVSVYNPFFQIGQAVEAIYLISLLKRRHQRYFNGQTIESLTEIKNTALKELNLL